MSAKTWVKMKRGIFRDPKHRQQMGDSIWLFGWLIDVADWETGVVSPYKDEETAAEMGVTVTWVRKHRRRLTSLGYIECTRHGPQGMNIKIAKWVNPKQGEAKPAPKITKKSDQNRPLLPPKSDQNGTLLNPESDLNRTLSGESDPKHTTISQKSDRESGSESDRESDPLTKLSSLYPGVMNQVPDSSTTNIFRSYESCFGYTLSPTQAEMLKEYAVEYTDAWVIAALKEAAKANIRTLSYVEGILRRCKTEGRTPGTHGPSSSNRQQTPVRRYLTGRKVA